MLKSYNDEFIQENHADYISCVSPFDIGILQGVSPRDIATLYNLASFVGHDGRITLLNGEAALHTMWCYLNDPFLGEGGSKTYINSFLERMTTLGIITISGQEIMLSKEYFSVDIVPSYSADHNIPVIAIDRGLTRTLYAAGNKRSTTLPLMATLLVVKYLHPKYRIACRRGDEEEIAQCEALSTEWLCAELKNTFYPHTNDDEIIKKALLYPRYSDTPYRQEFIYQYSDKIIDQISRAETLDDVLWRFLLTGKRREMLMKAPIIMGSRVPIFLR